MDTKSGDKNAANKGGADGLVKTVSVLLRDNKCQFNIDENYDHNDKEKLECEVGKRDSGMINCLMEKLTSKKFLEEKESKNSFYLVDNENMKIKKLKEHGHSASLNDDLSPLQYERTKYIPSLPKALASEYQILDENYGDEFINKNDYEDVKRFLKNLHNLPMLNVKDSNNNESFKGGNILKIGIILSGGPAPGGHNVISGIYDYAKRYNEQSQVIGFLGGIDGLYSKNYVTITDSMMNRFRNLGGFNMLWSGRGKVKNKDDLIAIENIVAKLKLNGLVIIGGDGSNSNAALMAEYFAERQIPISIIGVPKTIDGDLKSEAIEISFGFDTATRTYSEIIGNLCTDVKTGHNVYHVVRVMGRSASHVVLECALQTRPNVVLIGEEVEQLNLSLKDIVKNIVNIILKRKSLNKNYGVILLPEGLIEFVPEMKILISELNVILKDGPFDASKLQKSKEVWDFLPPIIRDQLLMDRESTGYIQVGKIATERLIIVLVESELAKLNDKNLNIQFMSHYLGYEGRCAIPSNFDCNYCYALGYNAALLIDHKKTGYMSIIRNLEDSYTNWIPAAIPFLRIMHVIKDNTGNEFPAVKRYLVDLNSPLFNVLKEVRSLWSLYDLYRSPGPIQFNGHLGNARCYTVKTPTKDNLLCQNADDLELIINLTNKNMYENNGDNNHNISDDKARDGGSSPTSSAKKTKYNLSDDNNNNNNNNNINNVSTNYNNTSDGSTFGNTTLLNTAYNVNGDGMNTLNCQKSNTSDVLSSEPVNQGFYEQHASSYKSLGCMSELQTSRLYNKLELPELCSDLKAKVRAGKQYISNDPYTQKQILSNYPHMSYENKFQIQEIFHDKYASPISFEIRIGIVFLSRQAPGAMNVLCGLYRRLKLLKGVCIAFYGLYGLLHNKYIIIDDDNIAKYVNQGGLELTGNSPEHSLFDKENRNKVCETVTKLQLNGLVMPGSNITITEAALLSEYFLEKKIPTSVVGIPLTGSNNLIHELIETCVGFDSSTKVYASLIGNVLTDAVSMPKYWHFIRLMGRSPSHEVLECALQTHPNVVIISEEYGAADKTLWRVVQDIADVVCARADVGKNYGTVLIPDALLMHLPHMKILLSEISDILNEASEKGQLLEARNDLVNLSGVDHGHLTSEWVSKLTPWSLALLKTFPQFIIKELLQVDLRSMRFEQLETEQLLLQMVKEELQDRKQKGKYSGSFMGLTHFFGYQGRSSLPSEFDCKLAYAYGHAASIVIESGLTGYIVSIRGLCGNVKDWKLFAIPFISLMKILPKGQGSKYLKSASKGDLPVIPSAPVDLNGKAYRSLKIALQKWQMEDRFCNPGPIQFEGNASNYYNRILFEEQSEYFEMLRYVECYANILKDTCRFGVSADYLKNVFVQLCGMLVLAYKPNDILSNMPYIGSIEDYYDWENQRKRMN